MSGLISYLEQRGLIQETSDREGINALTESAFYCGFDPTATSLQIGNLVPIFGMAHIARAAGLSPVVLFGGATGAIGDPSGKASERSLLEREQIDANVAKQTAQMTEIFGRLDLKPSFVNNFDWTEGISTLEFLRDIGKHFPMAYMLAKDSVKSRLNSSGISFTEFSYMLLQAYDFYHLYKTKNCRMQVGGSDQWGNITAGLELIRRKDSGEAYALTFPLITDVEGTKLGKTESGTLWVDPQQTSPYTFHQYWLNTDDRDVMRFLNFFTFHDAKKIAGMEESLKDAPQKREAHHLLADTLTDLVHGESATVLAKKSAGVLFGGSLEGVEDAELLAIFEDVPSTEISSTELSSLSFLDLLVKTGLSKSKGEARRLIQNGGAYLNNERVSDVELSELSSRGVLLLRSGKKNYHLVKRT